MADHSIAIARNLSPDEAKVLSTDGVGLVTAKYFFYLGADFLRRSFCTSPGDSCPVLNSVSPVAVGLTSVEQPPLLNVCWFCPELLHGKRLFPSLCSLPSAPRPRYIHCVCQYTLPNPVGHGWDLHVSGTWVGPGWDLHVHVSGTWVGPTCTCKWDLGGTYMYIVRPRYKATGTYITIPSQEMDLSSIFGLMVLAGFPKVLYYCYMCINCCMM